MPRLHARASRAWSFLFAFLLYVTCSFSMAQVSVAGDVESVSKKEGDDRVFESVEQLLAQAFGGQIPPASMLWLDLKAREQAKVIAQEDPGFRRRYWREDDTTVWVLDVIGRDHPITVGVIVTNDGIKAMNVLVYRESRGWEVRHEFFTKQFNGIELKDKKLDKRIDGITGATLSVRALQRAARLALWLHRRAIAG